MNTDKSRWMGLLVLLTLLLAACGAASTPAPAATDQMDTAPTVVVETPAATVQEPMPVAVDTPASVTTGGEGLSGVVLYKISQAETLVGFAVDEVLRGNPFTAQGVTDQVSGEITVNYDAATAEVGAVQIDARSLRTDSPMRDRTIAQFILQSGTYQTITFTPKSVSGLPATAVLGQEFTVQITGDLTIRDVTKEATFETKVTLVSPDRLEGEAQATVLRSDYGLQIPNVPNVASVSDNVVLKIEFVAVK